MAKVILDNQAFRDVITGHARRVIRDVVDDLKRLMIQSFGQQKHGRFYRRPQVAGGGRYQASARGEAPAIASGNLFRNLIVSFPTPLTGELLIDTPYARILEQELDRPFIAPAVQSVRERFERGGLGVFR